MKIFFSQFYLQADAFFPFSHIFQRYLSEETTKYITPSKKFIELHGNDSNLIFNVSAKKELAINELFGPKTHKRNKDVEFSIFLPYVPIMTKPNPSKAAIESLFEGMYHVLSDGYEIDIISLKKEQVRIINKILSTPEMFTESSI